MQVYISPSGGSNNGGGDFDVSKLLPVPYLRHYRVWVKDGNLNYRSNGEILAPTGYSDLLESTKLTIWQVGQDWQDKWALINVMSADGESMRISRKPINEGGGVHKITYVVERADGLALGDFYIDILEKGWYEIDYLGEGG